MPSLQDAARGVVAAREGVSLARAALALYRAGGEKLLGSATQAAIRATAETASGNVLGKGVTMLLRDGATHIAKTAPRETAKGVGKAILRGVGGAAFFGLAIDGAFATYEAVRDVRAGRMTKQKAFEHVGKEAATGALAAAAGTLACVGLVAVTGPLSVPALVVCGAGASFGAKTMLRRWTHRV
jgi:hypothetical protein